MITCSKQASLTQCAAFPPPCGLEKPCALFLSPNISSTLWHYRSYVHFFCHLAFPPPCGGIGEAMCTFSVIQHFLHLVAWKSHAHFFSHPTFPPPCGIREAMCTFSDTQHFLHLVALEKPCALFFSPSVQRFFHLVGEAVCTLDSCAL